MQNKAFKLQGSYEAVTLAVSKEALFRLRMKNSEVLLDVGMKDFAGYRKIV